ncbi:MAG: DUF2066 domain-containing protein [Alphaproteobacteria bacterium]
MRAIFRSGAAGLAVLLLSSVGAVPPAAAQEAEPLYRAVAIVTGTGEANRRLGLAMCLEEVLVKVSGDARLVGDRRVSALARRADTLVGTFSYRDRFAHRPINDEQGTRDRPHDLTVDFDPAKIDAELAALGLQPWTAARPRLVAFVAVNNGAAAYSSRPAASAAPISAPPSLRGAPVAVPVALPSEAALAAAGATPIEHGGRRSGHARRGGEIGRRRPALVGAAVERRRAVDPPNGAWPSKESSIAGRSEAPASTMHFATACAAPHRSCPAMAARREAAKRPRSARARWAAPVRGENRANRQSAVWLHQGK